MAYYNPYYEFTKTGSDFLKDTNTSTKPRQVSTSEIQSSSNPYQQPSRDWTGAIVGGLGQIGAAMQQPNNPNDFSVDGMAGYTSSAQGFMSGGAVGAIVGGISGQYGTFNKVHQNLNKLNTGVTATDIDPVTGQPVYQGQNIVAAQQTVGELNKGEKAIKNSKDPATWGISRLFGTRKRIRRKRGELQNNIKASQEQYNAAANDFNQQQSAMAQYSDMLNNQTRLKNLYSIGTNLY